MVGVRGVAHQVTRIVVPMQGVVGDLVVSAGLQIQLLQDQIVMGGDEYLHSLSLQFKQNFDDRPEKLGIQIGLGFILEQDRPFGEGAVLNQKP